MRPFSACAPSCARATSTPSAPNLATERPRAGRNFRPALFCGFIFLLRGFNLLQTTLRYSLPVPRGSGERIQKNGRDGHGRQHGEARFRLRSARPSDREAEGLLCVPVLAVPDRQRHRLCARGALVHRPQRPLGEPHRDGLGAVLRHLRRRRRGGRFARRAPAGAASGAAVPGLFRVGRGRGILRQPLPGAVLRHLLLGLQPGLPEPRRPGQPADRPGLGRAGAPVRLAGVSGHFPPPAADARARLEGGLRGAVGLPGGRPSGHLRGARPLAQEGGRRGAGRQPRRPLDRRLLWR